MHSKSCNLKRNKIKMVRQFIHCASIFSRPLFRLYLQQISAPIWSKGVWGKEKKGKKTSVEHSRFCIIHWKCGAAGIIQGGAVCATEPMTERPIRAPPPQWCLRTAYLWHVRSQSDRTFQGWRKVRNCVRGSGTAGETRGGGALVSGGEAPRDAS